MLKKLITLFRPHIFIAKYNYIYIRKWSFSALQFVALDRSDDYWWIAQSNMRCYASYKTLDEAKARYNAYKKDTRKGTIIPLP